MYYYQKSWHHHLFDSQEFYGWSLLIWRTLTWRLATWQRQRPLWMSNSKSIPNGLTGWLTLKTQFQFWKVLSERKLLPIWNGNAKAFGLFLLETTVSWKNGCSLQIRKFVLGAHGSKFHTSKIEYAVLFGFWKWTQNVHRILNLHWYPECHETRRSIWLLPLCPAIRWCLQQVGCCWWLPRSPARCQRVSETLSCKAWNGADYGLLAGSMDFWMMDDIHIYIYTFLIIYTYILYIVIYIYIYILYNIYNYYCTYHLILQFCRILSQGLNWGFWTAVLRTVGIPCFQLVSGPSCQGSDIGPIGEGVLNIEPWKATTQQDNAWASGFKMQEDCTHSDGDGIQFFLAKKQEEIE